MLLRDRFWLWGHPEGMFNRLIEKDGASRMTPTEACLSLGVPNVFMVPCGKSVNRRQYNKSFKTLRGVGWDCFEAAVHPEKIELLINDAKEFPNIKCGVFDDFKNDDDPGLPPRYKRFPIENLMKVIGRMRENPVRRLDSWMVLYTRLFGIDEKDDAEFQPFMDAFDGIILWVWKESDLVSLPDKYEIFKKLTPKNRRMFGCYLYNFVEGKQATPEMVRWQLDFYREKILLGEVEGVVLHTNTMADMDYEAYDAACEWMDLHGDETVADI